MDSQYNYTAAQTSIAHTFGNVTAFITEYVKNLFPLNYFKTVNISSSIAYRNFDIFKNKNTGFIKRNKPMLIIRPRIDPMNQDVFLNGTLWTSRITDNFLDRDFGNLMPFIDDETKGIQTRYLLNRMKMYFDINIIVESQMEQLNQVVFLKNRVRQEMPFNIDTCLESQIPRIVMQAIATDAGVDINDTKTFLDYLNSNALYPVTYKMKNSTGKDEYFRYYPAQIDTLITNLQIDDGSRKGFVDDTYTINFTIETEFSTAGLYYYFTQNVDTIKAISGMASDLGFDDAGQSVTPSYTVIDLFNIETPVGWNLYTAPLYKVDSDKNPDVLDISPLVNNSLQAVIQYHLDHSMAMDLFIKMTVIKDNEVLDSAAGDYSIDYSTMKLTTNKVNTTSTYRLVMHVNTLYINNLISEVFDLNEER